MSQDRTAETNGSRSFEERVFARFDGLDDRFERIESRIEKLEMKQYDTKPIWEQALAALAETNRVMAAGFDALRAEIATTNARMDAGFEQLRTDFDFAWRSIERKIDVLNHNILDLQAEQRYVDSRLEKLESPPKPS